MAYILRCESFDQISARHDSKCCSDCHEKNNLIIVTPHRIDVRPEYKPLDWELGIQGVVCCGRYDFVRSLSREWWVRRKAEVDGWSEAEVQKHLVKGSWHKTYENKASSSTRPGGRSVSRERSPTVCPKCSTKWNGGVCTNCGHSNL